MLPGVFASAHREGDSHLCFLGRSKPFDPGTGNWASKEMPKLWRYNLHYFDYLHDSQRSSENKRLLVTDWIRHNPLGTEDAWEPYTVSLRVVNWIKFFLSSDAPRSRMEAGKTSPDHIPGQVFRLEWMESLYRQALWLEQNIEYHLLANHYLKNGVALFFAGIYFEGADADRWIQKGQQILQEELDEQFLPDGGHFERSPMYHSICLVDYLDVLNLARNSRAVISHDVTDTFTSKVTAALDFLSGIRMPDGDTPLFNDSAFGIAPTPDQIFDYADRIIGYKASSSTADMTLHAFPATGYYVCRQGNDMLIIDCGPIGPDYQPGHAHSDTLSYELAIDGRRVIVDSGVYDYEPSLERAYARSTRAHNTVMVDGEEQSEVWGVFRVARRAKPLRAHIAATGHESALFEGGHDGYRRLSGKPIHTRRIACDGRGSWIVTDKVEGQGTHRMESFVHIHPDFTIAKSETGCFRIERDGEVVATIEAMSACRVEIEQGCYFSEFGLRQENLVIAFSCSGEIPLQLSYRIQRATSRQPDPPSPCESSSCHIISLPK